MRPDLDVLALHWNIDVTTIPTPTDDNWESLDPFQTAYLLLDRLNVVIASDLGSEFELGHGLLTPIASTIIAADGSTQPTADVDAWRALSKTWDDVLYPQLEDRYSGRPEQLIELLRVDSPPLTGDYAWTLRTSRSRAEKTRALSPVRTSELPLDAIKRSFRWLTR